MSARQEVERLQTIVASLPAQCRRVFELLKFEGLSHRDVAQRMGLSEKTIENHLTRALARIGAALATSMSGGDVPQQAEVRAKRAKGADRGND